MPVLLLVIVLLTTSLNYHDHGIGSVVAASEDMITSSCSGTSYPDVCYSTLSSSSLFFFFSAAGADLLITTKKDAIELTINKTKDTIQANLHTIQANLLTGLTKRAKMALHECLDMEAANLEQLDTVIHYLRNKKDHEQTDPQYANDLKTLMSTAITNTETCLDGLRDHHLHHHKQYLKGQLEHEGKMCSNVLDMIIMTTNEDHAAATNNNNYHQAEEEELLLRQQRNNNNNEEIIMWPKWLSGGDRRKLLGFGLGGLLMPPNVVVSKEKGKGNYTTVTAAVDAAPEKSTKRYIIKIMAGTYKEKVLIPKSKHNIMFIGEGRDKTIITGDSNVAAGNGMTTTKSATVAVVGQGFLARDITFQNTAGPSGEQAVALRVTSDLSAFYKCGMDGYQDTLYVQSNRQFYVKCFVTGTVDFIFGNAAVVFQFCDIMARKPDPNQVNMVTAQGRTVKNQDTAIVIHRCTIGATPDLKPVQDKFPTYLGRPWKEFSRTIVMRSDISDVIRKEGWHPWNNSDYALETLYYREYQNSGPGADTSKRVKWKGWGVIKEGSEARYYTVTKFLNGWTWLLSTGFPFWPGL
ncbi:hypothetical protein SSX86_023893 [Deinandra increscens subsp. villosa]|uniref:Pectinesterase n=1 Tax=Deinandra increscens subsp. villosa TaxID=3103831 RepID=A0AAP0CH14_9ASTR